MSNPTAWPHDTLLHAWWVQPDRLLAGEYPGDLIPEKSAAKLRLLINSGIGSIIDLTTDQDHLAPYHDVLSAEAEKAGRAVHHFPHPIPDLGVIDNDGYDAILDRITAEIDAGLTVYIHCWGGVGRTCTVITCMLCDAGLDYDSAMARIAALRSGTRKANRRIPESPPSATFCAPDAGADAEGRPDCHIAHCKWRCHTRASTLNQLDCKRALNRRRRVTDRLGSSQGGRCISRA
jgi:hypothetical protein